MDNPKNAILERLKTANTVLVTVSKNPSVDQLAALIGLTLVINKLNKHGSAVFSGIVPSTIEFLKPKDTIETNTDSLRDFIISLDRSKADKLRYKVEDKVVKIFITPYKTSLSENDLNFSQGDFNVELVIGLGVKDQKDLDDAITSHGRILHDATVATINTVNQGTMGSINWIDPQASSLSELVYDLAKSAGANLVNDQIATALLTGVVAETDRFSNKKTTPRTMSVAGELMTAGADQQLVTNSLQETNVVAPNPNMESTTLSIPHPVTPPIQNKNTAVPSPNPSSAINKDIKVDPTGNLPSEKLPTPIPSQTENKIIKETNDLLSSDSMSPQKTENGFRDPDLYVGPDSKFMTQPPVNENNFTANTQPEGYDPSTDPLSNSVTPGTNEESYIAKPKITIKPEQGFTPPPENWKPPVDTTISYPTLETVNPTNPQQTPNAHIDNARNMVNQVLSNEEKPTLEPIKALNAMPLGDQLHTGLDQNNSSVPPVPPPLPLNNNQNH